MIRLRTRNLSETLDLAGAISAVCAAGDVVVLLGDLGAGKTHFAKGFAAALGCTDHVSSPTFTLVHRYDAAPPLYHLDLYRLGGPEEVDEIGFSEVLDDDAIVLVEWGDRAGELLPADLLEIQMFLGGDDDERHIELRPSGPSWAARSAALHSALSPWSIQ